MGIPLRKGASSAIRRPHATVLIVNETIAARYFANTDPVGKMVRMPMIGDAEIIGVVGDIHHGGLQASTGAELFAPFPQFALSQFTLAVESRQPARAVAAAVKTAIATLDPQLPIAKTSAIDELLWSSIAQVRFNMALLVGLALSAAVLAAIGIYGVVSYSVQQRTYEIGLRMALGADRGRTFRQVVQSALTVVGIGVVIGLAAASVLGRALEGLLFGVGARDFSTFTIMTVAILAVAAVAAALPAARAARIDPVDALRQEWVPGSRFQFRFKVRFPVRGSALLAGLESALRTWNLEPEPEHEPKT